MSEEAPAVTELSAWDISDVVNVYIKNKPESPSVELNIVHLVSHQFKAQKDPK